MVHPAKLKAIPPGGHIHVEKIHMQDDKIVARNERQAWHSREKENKKRSIW